MAKRKQTAGGKKKLGNSFWKWVGRIILIIFIISILLPVAYKWINPPVTPLMLIRKVSNGAKIEYEWRDLEDISSNMVRCAVAAEDNYFLGHNGFDYGAIDQAIKERKAGGRRRGASTISQQTAKNVFLWPKSSWVRKAGEVYFTFLIEHIWGKERIMEVYLNVIEMGDGIYGAEAAAQHYFHTSADKLTRHQAALITVCYPNPLKFNPGKPSAYVNKRANKIVSVSGKIGKISFDDESIEKAQQRYQKHEAERKAKKKKNAKKF